MGAAGRRYIGERSHEIRTAGDEGGGQPSIADQRGRPVNVVEYRLDEARTLDQPGLERLPLARFDHQRHMGERPRAVRALLILVNAIEDAGLAQIAVARREPARQLLAA